MSKTLRRINCCPFTRKSCKDCSVYRGRHHYIAFNKPLNKNSDSKDTIESYFKEVEKHLNPWANNDKAKKTMPLVKLEVVDAESGKVRYCEVEETARWDWGDPLTIRIIAGIQIISFEHLVSILQHWEAEGKSQVKLYEFPRFMLLAGG